MSDEYTVQLCRAHHREVHRSSNEPACWAKYNIHPLPLAQELWGQSRAVQPTAEGPEAIKADAPGPVRRTTPARHPIGPIVVGLLADTPNSQNEPNLDDAAK